MIGCFIGGFVLGAFVCFGTLFTFAVLSLKKKQRQAEQLAKNINDKYLKGVFLNEKK